MCKVKVAKDKIQLGGYVLSAYDTPGDGDCALHALCPDEDAVALRTDFVNYLRY